jgi:hypothetical protein
MGWMMQPAGYGKKHGNYSQNLRSQQVIFIFPKAMLFV